MSEPRRSLDDQPFVCLECGERFPTRAQLAGHWAAEKHGPGDVQRAALERFRVGGGGDRFPDRT